MHEFHVYAGSVRQWAKHLCRYRHYFQSKQHALQYCALFLACLFLLLFWLKRLWFNAKWSNTAVIAAVGSHKQIEIRLPTIANPTVAPIVLAAPNDEIAFQNLPIGAFFVKQHTANCSAILVGDMDAIEQAKNLTYRRQTEYELLNLLQDCPTFHQQYYFAKKPLSQAERDYPIAYTISVNEHVDYLLKSIHATYAPQNLYCIHVDIRSSIVFFQTIERLSRCIPNIFIASKLESTIWGGYGIVQGVLNCLKDLLHKSQQWRYAITLQGHDFALRTNAELVDILSNFHGANDIDLVPMNPERLVEVNELVYNEEGVPSDLLKKNATKSPAPDNITIYKGSHAATMRREFVDFMLYDQRSIDLQNYIKDMSIPDEMLWSTLVHNVHLKAPGWYPGYCLDEKKKKQWITRYAEWQNEGYTCHGQWRHGICAFGYKDLRNIIGKPHLFVNKFYPEVSDPLAVDCMHEFVFNKTHDLPIVNVGITKQDVMSHVARLSAVRFQKFIERGNDLSEFCC